jgi:hypothetical protein
MNLKGWPFEPPGNPGTDPLEVGGGAGPGTPD